MASFLRHGLCPAQRIFVLFLCFLMVLFSPSQCLSNVEDSIPNYLKLKLLHRTVLSASPFHIQDAIDSDSARLGSFFFAHAANNTLKTPVVSGASVGSGQYFVDFRIGTPAQKVLLVADTGSDLVWVRCSACRDCTKHPASFFFFPRHSSSFTPVHCYASACGLVTHPRRASCNHTRAHSACRYSYAYGDGSVSRGIFSKETATLNASSGHLVRLHNVSFGCGFKASGASLTGPRFAGADGVMGLGRGPISFASQVGSLFGNKFSYCLMDYTISPPPTSFLLLGDTQQKVVPGRNISFTPLQSNPLSPTFYYVGIRGVSIDGVRLPINPAVWDVDKLGNGGTVIDSGTTLSFFMEPAYSEILKAFERRVRFPVVERGVASLLDLCLNVSGGGPAEVQKALPRLRFYMEGGVIFSPPSRNYFINVAPEVKCLAVKRTGSGGTGFSVIGNLMQQGFLFTFDRERLRVGFRRMNGCDDAL